MKYKCVSVDSLCGDREDEIGALARFDLCG